MGNKLPFVNGKPLARTIFREVTNYRVFNRHHIFTAYVEFPDYALKEFYRNGGEWVEGLSRHSAAVTYSEETDLYDMQFFTTHEDKAEIKFYATVRIGPDDKVSVEHVSETMGLSRFDGVGAPDREQGMTVHTIKVPSEYVELKPNPKLRRFLGSPFGDDHFRCILDNIDRAQKRPCINLRQYCNDYVALTTIEQKRMFLLKGSKAVISSDRSIDDLD